VACGSACPGSARARPAGVEIRRRDFLEGTWAPFLLHAATLRFRYPRAPAQPPSAHVVGILMGRTGRDWSAPSIHAS